MTPTEAELLAQTLREARLRKGLSATQVAKRASVDTATVTRIERGEIANPLVENLLAIAAVIDVPAADVFALRRWLPQDALPGFTSYLRAKYGYLPESAVKELQEHFKRLKAKYGGSGPRPGEDEY